MGLSMGRRLVLESSVSRFEPSSAGDCAARGAFWIFRTGDVRFRESLFQPGRADSEQRSPALYQGLEVQRCDSGEIRCRDDIRSRIWWVGGMAATENC